MLKRSSSQSTSLSYHPWIYFFIFLAANFLLSYFHLSLETRLWVGLFGLAVPFLAAWLSFAPPSSREKPLYTQEFLPPRPAWAWGLLAAAVLFLRFYKLTTLSVWPLYDEGMYGYYAAELSKQWNWQFLYGSSQAPPLYLWLLAGTFKILGVSLFSLWFLPALLSALLFPAGYWAARGLFSRSLSFLCACLMGFTFWPLYVGRFSLMTGLVLLAECLVLGLLARFWAMSPAAVSKKNASLLGLATGLGFYTYLHWPVLAAMVFLTLVFWARNRRKKGGAVFLLWFLLAGLAAVLPLAWGIWREGGGPLLFYLKHLSAGRAPSLADQLGISLSYVASLFWGMDLKYHTYQPVWGGYLNPVLGAFFFLGLLETIRRRGNPLSLWLLSGLFLFILPGALTSERATSRMILVFPVLAVLVVLGARSLAEKTRRNWRPVLLAFMAISLGLDGLHLTWAYPRIWENLENWKGYEKSYSRYQAFLQLSALAGDKGPGYIFCDFVPGLSDETLRVACFGFNQSEYPTVPPTRSWAGVLTNVNLQPFLKKEFPDGRAWWVSKDVAPPDGGWMLWVVPLQPGRQARIQRWLKASQALEPFLQKSLLYVPGQSMEGMVQTLREAYPFFKGDPFLESCYGEKMSDLALREEMQLARPEKQVFSRSLQSLSRVLAKGYPSANIYMKMGDLYFLEGRSGEAHRCYRKALKSPIDFTQSKARLDSLPKDLKND